MNVFICICAYTDLRFRKIPNVLIILMLIYGLFLSQAQLIERMVGFLIPIIPLFFLALKNQNIKGGDIKYLAVCGLYFGITKLAAILVPTTILAILFTVVKKEKSIPLGFVFFIGYLLLEITERMVL